MNDNSPVYLTLNKAVLSLIALFFFQLFIGIMIIASGYQFEWGDPRYVLLVSVLSYILFFSVLLRYLKTNQHQILMPSEYSKTLSQSVLMFGLPLGLISIGTIVGLSELTQLLTGWFPRTDEELGAIYRMLSGGILSFLVVCIVAPLAEEFLFRGIILRGFLAHYPVIASILLSALLFSLFHMTIVQIPTAFIIGCFYAWLYVKTASLWPSIIAHFLHNTFAFIIVNYNDFPEEQVASSDAGYSTNIIIVAMLACACGIYLLFKTLNKRPLSL